MRTIRNRRPRALLGSLAILSVLTVSGCGAGGSSDGGPAEGKDLTIGGETIVSADLMDKARDEGELDMYHIYPETEWDEVLEQFTEDTGIKVNTTRATTGDLFARIESEAAGGKLGADVIDFGDPILTQKLAKAGTIKKFQAPNADLIPDELKDPTGYSQVVEETPQVIAYNTKLVDEADAPKGFADLLDPEWKGKLSMTPIITGGSSFTVASLQRSALGADYWKKLAAQQPKLQTSVVPLSDDLARGANPVGISDLGLITSLIEKGAPLKPVFPEEGTPVFDISSMVSATAEHPDAAMVYEAWAASKRGGEVISEHMTAYPSNPDAELPEELPAEQRAKLYRVSLDDWIKNRDAYTKEWGAIFHYDV